MTVRLAPYVTEGFFIAEKPYSMHGRIGIDGWEIPMMIELTGRCADDLHGKTIRFTQKPERRELLIQDENDGGKLAPRTVHEIQTGATGLITADDWVRVFDCSPMEFIHRTDLGEQPPTHWKRRFVMEWFGPNGRTLIEIADPILEFFTGEKLTEEAFENDSLWKPLPGPSKPRPADFNPSESSRDDAPSGPEVIEVREKENGSFEERRIDPDEYENESEMSDLDRELAKRNREIERMLADDSDETIRECVLMDEIIDGKRPGKPFRFMIESPDGMPDPNEMDDETLEAHLKVILMELARFQVQVDTCAHLGPRDLYCILRNKILPEYEIHPELVGSGWITHIETWQECEACVREMDEEFVDREESAEPDWDGDEDPPF